MVTLSSNPSYQALAATAASSLGNPTSAIVKAILAQWQCELGNIPYPPTRNNPGNVAKGWADAIGIPYTVHFPNPQPGNPIVTYGSPQDGARSYAGGLRTFRRYAGVRAAVAHGDGRAFLLAITAAGYGTNVVCALRVYGGETGTVQTTPNAEPASSTTSTTKVSLASLLGMDPGIELTAANQADIQARVSALESRYGHDWVQHLHEFIGSLMIAIAHGTHWKLGDIMVDVATGGALGPGAVIQDIGAAIASLPGALGDVLRGLAVNGGMLLLILFLAFSGFRDVLAGDR